MRQCSYKFLRSGFFALCLWLFPTISIAAGSDKLVAETEPITLNIPSESDSTGNVHYDPAMNRYLHFWHAFIPNQYKLQYAGSIGIFSLSAGWHYGRQKRTWETDLFFGIVPKYHARCAHTSLALKQSYIPFRIRLGDGLDFEPLSCGFFLSTIFGEEFWGSEPSKYPRHYYGFSTKFRPNVFIGERLRFDIPWGQKHTKKALTFYYELSSNDLYIVSYVQNSYLSLWDILSLSFGVKFDLF